MAKRKANKGTEKLKKITTRAKAIRKKKPNMKWQKAVSQAAKELK